MSIQFLDQSVKFDKSETDTIESFAKELEAYAGMACEIQRGCNWYIGDLCNAAESVWRRHKDKLPGDWQQVVPVWMSHGHIERCRAVAAAYKPSERNINATWTIHANHAKDPDRIALVQAAVDAGQTSDENRKNPALPEPVVEPEPAPVEEPVETPAESPAEPQEEAAPAEPEKKRWLLAIDLNYYIRRTYERENIRTAGLVSAWLRRVIERLQAKGLTDAVCCFDSPESWRRELTVRENFPQPYKERTEKEPELVNQILLTRELMERMNLPCVVIDKQEADDVMASYAAQFPGHVTLLVVDKDLRQCLKAPDANGHWCNILEDMTWKTHPETQQLMPVYRWVIEKYTPKLDKDGKPIPKPEDTKCHWTEGATIGGAKVTGISPALWPHLQALAGDSTDDIKGIFGVGGKIASDLVKAHGTIQNVMAACKDGSVVGLNDKRLEAALAFAPFAESTLKLTTMRTDLPVPMVTTICMKEST